MHLSSVDPGGAMARAIPVSRVLGVVVHFSASSPAPGVVRHFSGDRLIIGEPSGTASARLEAVAKVLREAGFTVDVSDRIRQAAWYKLWGNLTINPVSALTGATSGQILDDSLVRGFCESAMLEAREIGARIGCPIEELPADRNLVTRKLGDFRTSMLQDAARGARPGTGRAHRRRPRDRRRRRRPHPLRGRPARPVPPSRARPPAQRRSQLSPGGHAGEPTFSSRLSRRCWACRALAGRCWAA